MTENKGDLISREALLKEVRGNKELFEKERVYLEGLLLNAPPVFSCNACKYMGNEQECVNCHDYSNYAHYNERPQCDCEKCDYRKVAERFVDVIVDLMNKAGITSFEQLSEILKGGAEE